MEQQDIENRIKKIVGVQLHAPTETLDTTKTWDELGADSLDSIEIVMAIEDEFEIEMSDEEAEKLTNIAEAIAFVTKAVDR